MSWGYFLDLDLTLPTAEWRRLSATRTADHPIPPEWWGFRERGLADMFGGPDFDAMTLGEAVARFDRPHAIGRVTTTGDETTLRVCDLLDRAGDPSIAKAIAALVEAAKSTARGALRLVNDGSYSGEDGIVVRVDRGAMSREAIADCWAITSKLGREIFGAELFEDAGDGEDDDVTPTPPRQLALWDDATPTAASKKGAAVKAGPKPSRATAAAKPAAAKPAAKPALTKPATAKKPVRAKAAATKPATAKKPVRAKAAANKPATAKTGAKPGARTTAKPAAKKPATAKPAATAARKNAVANKPAARATARAAKQRAKGPATTPRKATAKRSGAKRPPAKIEQRARGRARPKR